MNVIVNEMLHYEKILIAIYQDFFASIDKILISAERMATKLSLFEI